MNGTNLDQLLAEPLPGMSKQLANLLSWIAAQLDDDHLGRIPNPSSENLVGIIGTVDQQRVLRLIAYAVERGLVERDRGDTELGLSPTGWQAIEESSREEASGSNRGTNAQADPEWIGAAEALNLLGLGRYSGPRTICRRAHAGLIRARAERFIRDGRASDQADIPPEFWWAKGEAALTQNWSTGDFETWIDHRIHLEAFGVQFSRADIERSRSSAPARGQDMNRSGKKIFIGHGRSPVWRELKDFLEDRLRLVTDEFSSISTAGIATANRLEQMLEDAAFAFLVLTAEDEQADGTRHARLNVVHEAGLFQGRLGFDRAIILLEEACEEFSNIHGLGQIRFPTGNVSAKFEEIRRVLERERIIASS